MQAQLAKNLIEEIRGCLTEISIAMSEEPTVSQMETLKCLRNVAEVAQEEVVNGVPPVQLPILPPPTRSRRQRQVEEEGRKLGQRLKHPGPPAALLNPPAALLFNDDGSHAAWGGDIPGLKAPETFLHNGVRIPIT